MKVFRRFRYLIGVSLALLLSNYLGARIIYNPSISETRGYYFTVKSNNYSKGSIVRICLTDSQYIEVLKKLRIPFHNKECPSGMSYLLKTISAVKGDKIVINNKGVFINGVLQKNSNAIDNYRGIDLYPTQDRRLILKEHEFFVLGKTPHSYDSRYFGVIQESQIAARAYLIYAINHKIW